MKNLFSRFVFIAMLLGYGCSGSNHLTVTTSSDEKEFSIKSIESVHQDYNGGDYTLSLEVITITGTLGGEESVLTLTFNDQLLGLDEENPKSYIHKLRLTYPSSVCVFASGADCQNYTVVISDDRKTGIANFDGTKLYRDSGNGSIATLSGEVSFDLHIPSDL